MRDRSLLKLFRAGVLHVLDPKGHRVPFREDGVTEPPAPVVVTQKLDSVTEDQARELLKRFPHLATPPVAPPATPSAEPAAPTEAPEQAPRDNGDRQRPQGNGNQRR
jgi:hypothetical protein